MAAPDVVVIGGGIIGLAVADALVNHGARVTVLERRNWGAEASGAAAGMLAPLAEAQAPGPFLMLALAGLAAHPPWLERLRAETGLDMGPHGPGMLRVLGPDETGELSVRYGWQKQLGLPLQWLCASEARALEPALQGTGPAILSPLERHVQPPLIVQALSQSLIARGGVLQEEAPARGFDTVSGRVLAVRTDTERVPCGQVVIAGGAWTPAIAAELGANVEIEPIRGQILALAPTSMPLRHTVYGPAGYLVPKPDGRLVVGATEDRAGFTSRPTAEGVARLLAMATRLAPELASAPFVSAWAGLRPAAADRLPLLGALPEWENVTLATGHYRNGVLLAPLTGSLIAHWIVQRQVPALMHPFLPERAVRPEGNSVRDSGVLLSTGVTG